MKAKSLTFKKQLNRQTGEFIMVLINSGENCCYQKGILCDVQEDYLVLVNQKTKSEIPLSAVVAFKKNAN